MVQPVVDRVVFTALDEGGPEFPLCGWFPVSYGGQTGFFQMNVQLLHLVRGVGVVSCNGTRIGVTADVPKTLCRSCFKSRLSLYSKKTNKQTKNSLWSRSDQLCERLVSVCFEGATARRHLFDGSTVSLNLASSHPPPSEGSEG